MKKNAFIFIILIFLPAVVLGVLAFRAAGQQKMVIENQEVELRQTQADEIAAQIRLYIAAEFLKFKTAVDKSLPSRGVEGHREEIITVLRQNGLMSGNNGALFFEMQREEGGTEFRPETGGVDQELESYLELNRAFYGDQKPVALYQSVPQIQQVIRENQMIYDQRAGRQQKAEEGYLDESAQVQASIGPVQEARQTAPAPESKIQRAEELKKMPGVQKDKGWTILRSVAPRKQSKMDLAVPEPQVSSVVADYNRFSEIVAAQDQGIISRYVNDRLEILFWYKMNGNRVFCLVLPSKAVEQMISAGFPESLLGSHPDVGMAILDNRGRPVSEARMDKVPDWKKPFVATEIGEVLPYWEVGVYFRDPERLEKSAQNMRLILMSVIALAIAAICAGVWFILHDTRQRMEIAQKKTDFVSNVSHELKTPLTSIRMFAELLLEGRVREPEKVTNYLRIITWESERLTRLINNVLDFAKIEKGRRRYDKKELDLYEVIEKIWEGHALHLGNQGFQTQWHAQPGPYRVIGDEDALSQVLVNLLSNAEKYSDDRKVVELHTICHQGTLEISVLDRGMGVPAGEEKKIFERFYRAHDGLSSGVQGSGLGLTLALKIAQDHGGTIKYEPRKEGGSRFTLILPLAGGVNL